MKRYLFVLLLTVSLLLVACGQENGSSQPRHTGLRVVTTLFPLYDFARQLAGSTADVYMLLPPATEPHVFEPRPGDVEKIRQADIFIYTGEAMEPWVPELLRGIDAPRLLVVDASYGLQLPAGPHGGKDPHVWLDFANAAHMVDVIAAALASRDQEHAETYRRNANGYKEKLAALDARYRAVLGTCPQRTFVHAGHYAFGYLARRYDLRYIPAYQGTSDDAEPSPRQLAALLDTMKRLGLKAIFYDELIDPRLARVIQQETGAVAFPLNAAANVSRDELRAGVTFLSLMEKNLANLQRGLPCP